MLAFFIFMLGSYIVLHMKLFYMTRRLAMAYGAASRPFLNAI
ncbi:Uncharacterised protein [Plesiomonas shigelloides]|nr:Uncharacterised protein [Plesiomonas shigelloides]